ncbi:hypothetical protein B0H14DRAFT_2560358 [Mycena olivaceomarginata]|nr:hypothetical protein B0H14DRAFT_2560358 [Mycena olivaceomarginata]
MQTGASLHPAVIPSPHWHPAGIQVTCELAGAIRGEKGVFITHILGSRTTSACPHASKAAQTEAKAQREGGQAAKAAAPSTKRARSPSTAGSVDVTAQKKFKQTMLRTYTGNDMPFSAAEADAIEAQALRAIISSNSPFRLFEDPEMLTLVGAPALPKWKRKTLAQLFGGSTKKHVQRLSQKEIEAEAELMMALAEAERQADEDEDAQPDNGAVEIPSEEELGKREKNQA